MLKKYTTKLAALSVALCLTLTLMPGAAFAEGSDPPPGESIAGEVDIATPSNTDPATDGVTDSENEPPATVTDGISLGESSDTATPATATPGVVITIVPESEYISLSIPQGKPVTDAALLKGVTAVDENGNKIEVKVADYGGLDRENPQPKGEPGNPEAYIITYAAEGAEAVTRECFVTVRIMPLGVGTPTVDGEISWQLDGNTLTIRRVSGDGKMTDYTGLYPPWYSHATDIQTVTIEDGVTSIGDQSFYTHKNLKNISIPDSVTTIGYLALGYTGLQSVNIPDSVTSIGESAFNNCTNLEVVEIGAGVTGIGRYAFQNCTNLEVVKIGAGVTGIAHWAFRGCSGLEKIYFEGDIPIFGMWVFDGVPSTVTAFVPDGMGRDYENALQRQGSFTCTVVADIIPPGAPRNFKAEPGDGQVTLTWDDPEKDGGADIRYEVSKDGGSTWTAANDNAAHIFTGLTNDTSYTFMVRAVNEKGSGPAADIMETPVAAPTYSISATPSTLDFGSLESPYTQPAAQTVTVKNTGTGAVTLATPTGAANYIIGALSTDTLTANGNTAIFTVQPKENLQPGTYNETITITGSDGATATVQVNFTVGNPAPVPVLTLGDLSDDTATVGEPYNKTASYFYDGSNPLAFSLTGSLPSGLSFSAANGSVSGTPAIGTARDYPLTITVKETGGTLTASKGFTLTVQDAPIPVTLTVEPPEDDSVLTGYDYAKTFSVTYTGTDALLYSAIGLPSNLTINADTGMITGIPASAGQHPVTVTVKEQNGSLTASASYLLTVSDVRLTLGALADDAVTAGSGYTKQITYDYTGRKPLTFSATGLPSGIAVDSANGAISGSTDVTGNHAVTVAVTDGAISASGNYILTVNPAPTPTPTPTPAPTPQPSRDNSNDDDGSFYTPNRASAPAETWMSAGNITNPSRSTGKFGIRAAAWARLTGPYYHDSMSGSAVQVRAYFDSPGLFTKDTYVSGWMTGADTDRLRAIFGKWFSNEVQAIHFDQTGQWETQIRVAAKIDLAGWDTKWLYFYVYAPKTNRYTRIANPEYWIDANGYLHFQTGYTGEIIISEGELEKR